MSDSLLLLERNKLLQNGLRELAKIDLVIDGNIGAKTLAAFKQFATYIGFEFDKEPTTVEGPLADKVHSFAVERYCTDADFQDLAKQLVVPESYVRAVAEVETRGNAFLVDGRSTILFERHKFNSYLTQALSDLVVLKHVAKLLNVSNTSVTAVMKKMREEWPNICSTTAGGYHGKEKEYVRMQSAQAFDTEAAMRSASWGRFQIMGFNFQLAGYSSAVEMALDYEMSEKNQLKSLAKFILNQPAMLGALRRADWAGFAKLYNGSNYAINQYDVKMFNAEKAWAKVLAA